MRPTRRHRAGTALAILGLTVGLTLPVGLRAATLAPAGVSFTVTSTSDAVDANLGNGACAAASGACTLRAAIQQANALAGADTIVLPAGTYELAIPPLNQNLADVGDLDITESLTISGAGAGATIVDGGTPAAGAPPQVHGLDRLFEIAADEGTVVFSQLTLREGWAAEYGGAIMNASSATVTVVDAMLSGNGAGKTGGAIDNHFGGTVEVRRGTLQDNYAAEAGSALNNNRGGMLTVTDSVVASNSAADAGLDETLVGAGAISNNAELDAVGTLTVTGSRIADNRAGGGRNGAGISNDGAGALTVTGTTFTGNRAIAEGGAIFNLDGPATVTGSTFTENTGNNGGAISSSGQGSLSVADTAFTKNVAGDWGGAIQNGNKGSVNIRSSTFTENTGLNGGGFGNEGSGLVTVESSTFTKNAAVDSATAVGGEGGGMHSNSGGEVAVTGGAFVENRALSGGGLSNEGGGQLTVTDTRFTSNRADEAGGGILIQSGDVRMVDIDVVGNLSDSPLEGGGGVSYAGDKIVSVGETAAIESSRIRDNIAKGDGGGIDSRGDGPLVISTTSITGNTAAIGGAVHHVGDAPLQVKRSTLSGNSAENGAGIFTDGDGETTVENTTVSGNRAGQFGGGLLVSSRLTLRNGTVAANAAPSGGGINNGGGDLVGDGTVFLANSIVAGNTGGNCAGTITSRGGNVENANNCQLVELSDQPGTDPRLGPLAANGGPTLTHALLQDSPAQDKAACTDEDPCPPVDQRGVARPAFGGIDAGAYESDLGPGGGGESAACTGRTERPVQSDYDSFISQGAPGSNFGGDSILKVDPQSGANERALVHFTLPAIPPGCKLVGASLRLYSSAATNGRALEALRITSDWSEGGVTWANQPATGGAPAATESGLDVREWDVLAQALDMYRLGASHGFLIRDRDSGTGEQSFHSREKGADRPPELTLVFDDPDAPPAAGDCTSPTPLRLAADRDSWISESSPTNNFGSDSTLKIKSQTGSNSRVLIRFPLPTLGAGCTTVASATLRMEATSAKEARSLVARPAASPWTEAGVTWANQPDVAGPTATTPSLDGPLEWDVTAAILGMYVSANNGFVIRDADENGVGDEQTINSRHKITDVAPELVLVFDDSTPETTIDSGPTPATEEVDATFTFFSDRADATFECSLDSGAFAACTSPHTVRGLPLGTHLLEVRAKRPIRAVDPIPASESWSVVDLTPPVVSLAGTTGETEEPRARFEFSANEAASFACSLDGVAVAGCASPLELSDLVLGPHTLEVVATDASGNVGPASLDWTVVDLTAPTVTLVGPEGATEERSAELVFAASEAASFSCALNGVEIAACASPQLLTDLALGAYEFEVEATDPSGNTGSAAVGWEVVDRTAPVVTLTGPPATTEETNATFEFSVSEEAALECTLDGMAVPACASPLTRDALRLGVHVFEVSATDPSGNTGRATHEWKVVDVTAPLVTLDGPGAETEDTSATLTFSASEPAALACTLDGIALAACESPLTLNGLALGAHRLEVSATDPSGNTGSGAHEWQVVDRTPPTVTLSGPEGETEETSATFTFSASEPATLACALDGISLAECTSPLTVSGLSLGLHALQVSATDPAGNTGSAMHGWVVVDRTAPTVTLIGPEAETESPSAELTFSANETATFACTLDDLAVADCASPLTLTGLALGDHRFVVEATDASGNTGSAVLAWSVVDRTAPTVTLTGPEAETEETSATLAFSANEPATLVCLLDGTPLPTCESPAEQDNLALGPHAFVVKATDTAGNTGSATHAWSVVDRTAPVVTLTGPEEESESTEATFVFSASETATLACSLDGAGIADCASPLSRSGLALGPHRFDVTARDASGNMGSATHSWLVVDRTSPLVTLDGPVGETEETSATLTFSANEPATLACTLDSVAVVSCESPLTRSGLALGAHRFDVTATDASGNAGSATLLWTIVDRTAPEITLTGGPPTETEEPSASFTFSATENATLECRLDDAAFAACSSGAASYSGLGLGAHRFDVRATDAAGNSASASHLWTVVDRSGPVVSLTGPAAETSSRTATLTFSADEPATFTCALDGVTPGTCSSPVELTDLALGPHSFRVVATDSPGNVGAATHTWTIVPPPDTGAPLITIDGPTAETNETSAHLIFSANETVAGFRCSLDDATAADCTSPVDLAGLGLGPHTFRVEATDLAGNAGAATHAWTIKVAPDTTAPLVTIAGPPATTSSTSASLTFTADEPATFRCALDSDAFESCASSVAYSGLSLGEHVFRVEATDGALNQSVTGYAWTVVDSSAPAVTISSGPESPTTATSAAFVFSADEAAAFSCSLDGGAPASCASGVTYSGLAVGQHTFEVRAADTAGNVGSASWVWSIDPPRDTTAPVVTITSGPSSGTTATTATFAFSANETATFRCALDTAGLADCTTGVSYSGLAVGPHTFRVEARDAAGNVGSAAWSWTIDAAPPAGCTQQALTLGANADTWLLETSPSSNYGQDSVIKVDTKAGANARSLVRFELPAIPAGCALRDVKLRLYAGSYKTGRTLLAVPVGSGWLEGSVTWSSQPTVTGAGVAAASGAGYVEWSVTSLLSGASGNVSFLIRDAAENGNGVEQGFHGREKGADNPPRLVVTFG